MLLCPMKTLVLEALLYRTRNCPGFTEPVSIAKLLLRNGHNPNDGYSAAAIEMAVLPNATLGSLAFGMNSAGFTSETVIKGVLSNRFDDTLVAELKGLGFSSQRAAEILHSAC